MTKALKYVSSNILLFSIFLLVTYTFTGCDAQSVQQTVGTSQATSDSVNLTNTTTTSSETASISGRLEVSSENALGIFVFAEGTSHIAITDSRGEFEISNVPVGQYDIYATRGGSESLFLADTLVTQEIVSSDSAIVELGNFDADSLVGSFTNQMASAGTIRGSVVTARPQDQTGVLVEIAGTEYRTSTDSQGEFTLANIKAGNYSVRFSQQGYVTATRPVNVSGTENIDLPPVRLSARNLQTIDGRAIIGEIVMLDITGQPVDDYSSVYLTLNKSGERHYPDQDGLFEIRGLTANQYIVNINASGYKNVPSKVADLSNTELAELTFILEQDEDAVDLTSLIIGQVLLEEAEEQGNAGVSLTLAGTSYSATSDAIGTFQIDGVPEGEYTLVASLSGYETTYVENIEVAPSDVVELEPFQMALEVDPPKVVATNPSDGQIDVTIVETTIVQIIFDQPMDPESVRGAISISPDVSYNVRTRGQHPLADQDRVVIELAGFTRNEDVLKFGTRYRVNIDSSASNVEGVEMEEDYEFSFTTGEAKVTGTFPADGAENAYVNISNPIRVMFNVGLDTDLFDADDVRIRPEPTVQPDIYIVNQRQTGWGELVIAINLEFEEEYEITIRDGLRSLTNDRISNLPYSFSFTTTSQTEGIQYFDDQDSQRDRIRQERNRRN